MHPCSRGPRFHGSNLLISYQRLSLPIRLRRDSSMHAAGRVYRYRVCDGCMWEHGPAAAAVPRVLDGPGVGIGSWGWLVHFRAQISGSEPPRRAMEMGGWVCKISNFQDI